MPRVETSIRINADVKVCCGKFKPSFFSSQELLRQNGATTVVSPQGHVTDRVRRFLFRSLRHKSDFRVLEKPSVTANMSRKSWFCASYVVGHYQGVDVNVYIAFLWYLAIVINFIIWLALQSTNVQKKDSFPKTRAKPPVTLRDCLWKYGGDFRNATEEHSSSKGGFTRIKNVLQQGGRDRQTISSACKTCGLCERIGSFSCCRLFASGTIPGCGFPSERISRFHL